MKNTLPTKPGVRRNSAAFGKKNTATFNGLLTLFLMVMGIGVSWGQYWNGTSTASNSGSISNITSVFGSGNNNGTVTMISTTSASSGYTTASSVVSTGTSNFGVAALNQTLSPSTSSYFSVTLTPTSTYAVTLASINFGQRGTGSGPTVLTVYSSIDNYTTALQLDPDYIEAKDALSKLGVK